MKLVDVFKLDETKYKELVKSINNVSSDLINALKPKAQKLTKKFNNDAFIPLAAAMAILTGEFSF